MCDCSLEVSCRAKVHLVASPHGLVKVFDAVDKAISSPSGRASVQLTTPRGESFTLYIVR